MKTVKITLLTIALILPLMIANATARIQIIHNSPDTAAAVVDVWLNNTKLLSNFEFRTATPFIDAPSGVLLNISIAPPNSTSWTQALSIKQVVLTQNQTYIAVASGILNTSTGYTPSPVFTVDVVPIGREAASQTGNTDVLAFHGSPDAPVVDVVETGAGAGTIINDFAYNEFRGYLELPTADYILEVRDSSGMNTVVAYQAPLAGLGLNNQALVLMASGFLNPAVNNNGPAFGLFAALPAGGNLIPLPITVGMNKYDKILDTKIYPNPAINDVNVQFEITDQSEVRIRMYDLMGKEVASDFTGTLPAGIHQTTLGLQGLRNGTYFVVIEDNQTRTTSKLQIAR